MVINVSAVTVQEALTSAEEAAREYWEDEEDEEEVGIIKAEASNKLIAVNQDQDILDSEKRIKAATVEDLETKLQAATSSSQA